MKNKKIYIDYLRIIATIAVIIIHIFTTARTDFPNHTIIQDNISLIIVQFLHFSVPLFLMITGSLFLNKQVSIKELYKKYILKYIIILFTFGLLFSIIECLYEDEFSLNIFLIGIKNVLIGNTWNHMWYLYMLIGVLMILPILQILTKTFDTNIILRKYFIILMIISTFIYPLFNTFLNIEIPFELTLFSNYILYMFIGYFIDKKYMSFQTRIYIILIITIPIVIITLDLIFRKYNLPTITSIGGYSSLLTLLSSFSIFGLFKAKEKKLKENRIIRFLSDYSFGVYIMHMFWINIVYKYFCINLYDNILIVLPMVLLITFSSYLTSYILKKIPIIKQII